ncbi:MAG TPA: hypothetical protein VFJ97_06115 [Dermatophilaceae bacterium]|nr:hypothetical protein [Dermatophilaceae bacterium]
MADISAPRAARLQRPSWRDSRLVVGLVIVLLSVGIGAKVVAAADDTQPMYAAARILVAGQPVTQEDLRRVDVRIAGDTAGYLAADHDIAAGTFALREVLAGELVPTAALGTRAQVGVKPVTVPAERAAVARLIVGSVVDVWVNAKLDNVGATYGKPQRVLESASVAGVPETGGGFGSSTGIAGVEVLVPDERVADLIAAIDQGAKVTLVPVPGSPLRGAS